MNFHQVVIRIDFLNEIGLNKARGIMIACRATRKGSSLGFGLLIVKESCL